MLGVVSPAHIPGRCNREAQQRPEWSSYRRVTSTQPDYKVRSHALPGGDLVSATLNRQVMGLADRGGSSGLVGKRWADWCAEWMQSQVGSLSQVPAGTGDPFVIERFARLDDLPRIASVASKRGLQNPDVVIVGNRADRSILQAADAKFSVETARSKQVSPAVVEALLGLGSLVRSLTGDITDEIEFVPGVFLSPDFSLTHLMLQGRHGITRATVHPSEVVLVPVDPSAFFRPLQAASVIPILSALDDLPVTADESLLAGLYYFRLARATVGSWIDSVRPLLTHNDVIDVDEAALETEARRRSGEARSAFDLVLRWDADVEAIRARRAAVDQVTGLPVMTKDLRNAIDSATGGKPENGPSVNQLRRRLGSWFRGEIRSAAGPIMPDEADFSGTLQDLAAISRAVAKGLPERTAAVIRELIEERAAVDAEAGVEPNRDVGSA